MKVDQYYIVRYTRKEENYENSFFTQFVGDGVAVFIRRNVSMSSLPVKGQSYSFRVDPFWHTSSQEEELPGKFIDAAGYIEDKNGNPKPYFVVSENWSLEDWQLQEGLDNASPQELTKAWEEYFEKQMKWIIPQFKELGWELEWKNISHIPGL